jgi:2-methylisocitrate lyase-like PEP mutase family enzyme
MTEALAARATTLLDLHRPGRPLLLVNAWDPGSARVVAGAGAAAVATGSAGVAFALGRPDGERLSREEMLAVVRAVVSAVAVPVKHQRGLVAGAGGDHPALADRARGARERHLRRARRGG